MLWDLPWFKTEKQLKHKCRVTGSLNPAEVLSHLCSTGEKLDFKTETFVLLFTLNLHILNITIFLCSVSILLLLCLHTYVCGVPAHI